MTREASNELRAKCRRRWVGERAQWRIWRAAIERHRCLTQDPATHQTLCLDSARKRMREAAAARLSTAAREKTAAASSSTPALGSANVSGAHEQSGVDGEWVAKLRATDQRAREGATFCWENACSVEAINMGDKFWAIHCDILAILEGAGGQSSDSEPRHSPSDSSSPTGAS